MTDDNDLRIPAPADVADRIDRDLVAFRLGALIESERPDLVGDLFAGRITWQLEEFDAEGCTSIRVVWTATGEDTGCGAQTHWSSIVRTG